MYVTESIIVLLFWIDSVFRQTANEIEFLSQKQTFLSETQFKAEKKKKCYVNTTST